MWDAPSFVTSITKKNYIYRNFSFTFIGILFLYLWEFYFDFYRNFVTLQRKYY